ncbi:sensor domain-containing diguanylate cyclase [Sulfuricurvum sp.]|uniref:sensor domain-containing diguanylate cyclase n=1 Tax=Sulfuricurvum sp. TaxID=2025608 RepID=UPI00260CEAE9|nr:sensor domain-containing diguanylate cyclase [Sulfuricurvum sp.]MDD2267357.1 diguanylate cyclase [Sulfuricurvum sp.]MDD2784659.1 diguanylate cyclase [Sulfuricurvum sp.]
MRIRLIDSYLHHADKTYPTLKKRLRTIRIGTFISAIIWGSIGVLLVTTNDIIHLVFLIFILAGLTAGNTVSNASDLPSSIGFSILALSPITVYLLLDGTDIYLYMGQALTLYFVLLVIISRYINTNITKSSVLQYKAEASAKEARISEERYRLILQYSPAGIVHYNKELIITYCNDRFAHVMKAPKERLIGLDIKTLKDQRMLPSLREALEGKEGVYEGQYHSTLSNTQLWIIMSYAPLRDAEDNIEGGIAIIEDITERKKTEEETTKLLNNLRQAEKIAQLGNWHFEIHSNTLEWSDEIFNIFELDKNTFYPTYEAFLNVIHPDDRFKVAHAYEHSLETKQKYEITHRLLMKDGKIKYVNEQCETKFDPNGIPICSLGTVQDITQQMQYQIRLENSENTLRYLLKMSPIAVRIAKNSGQEVIFANEAYAHLIHADISDVIGKNPKNYYANQEHYNSIVSRINNNEIIYNQLIELYIENKTLWVLASYMPIEFEGESCVLGWFYDITEEKNLQKEVEQQRDEFKALFNTSKDGIAILDQESNFLDFNDAYLEMTGFSRAELLTMSCISLSAPEDRERAMQAMKNVFEFGFVKGFEKTCVVKDGKRLYINMTATLLPDKQRILITTKDISAMKEHARQLEHLAHYDPLTGLPNRILESDRLQQGMFQTQRRGERLAVFYLDLDGFKQVNDSYGHDVGDQLLISLSARMKQALREGDTLSRLGGDEFVAIVVDLNDTYAALPIIERLLDSASRPIQIGDLIIQVSASIGVTFYPQETDVDGDQLVRQADQAMYVAKQSGKNRYHIFDFNHS